MAQRVKRRYKPKTNSYPTLTLTGRSCLKHWEESNLETLAAGDVQFYLYSCTLGRVEDDPGYDHIGGSGYLKARVFDGKEWQLLVMDTLFKNRCHHFNRSEMPYDTYVICHEHVQTLVATVLERSYRNHYEPIET